MCIWLAFFPTMLVPYTSLADPGSEVTLAGIHLNLLGAILNIILLAIAFLLLRANVNSANTPAAAQGR
jgi:hypothetical protein